MLPTRKGSFRLFRILGIDVFLHWSWIIVALYEIQVGDRRYSSILWNAFEYLALFAIVLLHECGHAFACRQVGGRADQIVLWPFGGVAYVAPPQRPGAMLWSIAAGPLVNVLLAPILTAAWLYARSAGWPFTMPDLYTFVWSIWIINLGLLIFNLLPIYPLDGGQILRTLLWFPLGRGRSLMISSAIGFVGVAGVASLSLLQHSIWPALIAVLILYYCWRGLLQARALEHLDKAPRRPGLACPSCRAAPPTGSFWGCGKCRQGFDVFETQGVCPHCGAQFTATSCVECGKRAPLIEWNGSLSLVPDLSAKPGESGAN